MIVKTEKQWLKTSPESQLCRWNLWNWLQKYTEKWQKESCCVGWISID